MEACKMLPAPQFGTFEVLKSEPADRDPLLVYLASLGVRTRVTVLVALDCVADILTSGVHDARSCPWGDVRYQHVEAVRAALRERFSVATANLRLSCLRAILKRCWLLDLMSGDDYQRAAAVQGIKGSSLPKGRALPVGEIQRLFETCREIGGASGARDAALIAIAYGGGLRRRELVMLNWEDLDLETGELKVLHGKGGKQRLVHLQRGAIAAVTAWRTSVHGNEVDRLDDVNSNSPLLRPVNRHGKIMNRRMAAASVFDRLKFLAEKAGIPPFSPHDLRRSFISGLLDAGGDLSSIQGLAGHSNIATTAAYDRRPESARRKTAQRLNVPY